MCGGGQLNCSLKHRLIIGDNYPALQNLLISYRQKIKVIYIDPPYGKDDMGNFADTNYNNAITRDNLLSMLYPRLQLARELLRDDGVIFCSIDDKNQAYVKCLFDEIFGEGNFVSDFIRKTKSTTNDAKTGVNYQHEFLLCYAKDKNFANLLGGQKDLSNYKNPDNDPNGEWVSSDPTAKSGDIKTGYFAVKNPYTGKEDYPTNGRFWRFSQNTMQKHIDEGHICFKKEHKDNERGFIYKRYLKELKTEQKTFDSLRFTENSFMNQSATKELLALGLGEIFKYPKGVEFIKEILRHSTTPNNNLDSNAEVSLSEFVGCQDEGKGVTLSGNDQSPKRRLPQNRQRDNAEGDIILDFFAGSGTTAHATLELNREDGGNRIFILVTNNEKTDINPNGIALDVTTKRLKRIMSGECYNGDKSFKWLEKNKPYGGILEVSNIDYVNACETQEGQNAFALIDETLYGKEKFSNINDKIAWVCENFSHATKILKVLKEGETLSEKDYIEKIKKEAHK